MLLVRVWIAEHAQVPHCILIGLGSLVTAGDIKHLHAVIGAELQELGRTGRGGDLVLGNPAVPDRIVKEILVLIDQVAPVIDGMQDGVVHVSYHGQGFVADLAFGQRGLHMHAGYVEALVVKSTVLGRSLLPCHGIEQGVVDTAAARTGGVGTRTRRLRASAQGQ